MVLLSSLSPALDNLIAFLLVGLKLALMEEYVKYLFLYRLSYLGQGSEMIIKPLDHSCLQDQPGWVKQRLPINWLT